MGRRRSTTNPPELFTKRACSKLLSEPVSKKGKSTLVDWRRHSLRDSVLGPTAVHTVCCMTLKSIVSDGNRKGHTGIEMQETWRGPADSTGTERETVLDGDREGIHE